jgi:hypothetical protein
MGLRVGGEALFNSRYAIPERVGLKTLRSIYETPPAEGFHALYYEVSPSR